MIRYEVKEREQSLLVVGLTGRTRSHLLPAIVTGLAGVILWRAPAVLCGASADGYNKRGGSGRQHCGRCRRASLEGDPWAVGWAQFAQYPAGGG